MSTWDYQTPYRNGEKRDAAPLVNRLRSDQEWRLMKEIAADKCRNRRALVRTLFAILNVLVIGAVGLAVAEFHTDGRFFAACVFVIALVLAMLFTLDSHSSGDDRAVSLVCKKLDLDRERSK